MSEKFYCIILTGKSIIELEQRIEEFRNLNNIVWCSINQFNLTEPILRKIDKSFDIIFDTSTVGSADEFELCTRLPRLIEFLSRNEDNKYITQRTHLFSLRERLFREGKIGFDFNQRFANKIIYVDDLGIPVHIFYVSLPLFITSLIKLGAKPERIILFGADGVTDDTRFSEESFYKPDLIYIERVSTGIKGFDLGVDVNGINKGFDSIMRTIFGYAPEIINCSPIMDGKFFTKYTPFKNMTYDQTIDLLKS